MVDQVQHRAGMTALAIVDGLARGTLAGAVPARIRVILRNGYDVDLRRFRSHWRTRSTRNARNSGFGGAELRSVFVAFRVPPLAINQAEPFGMFRKVLIRRHQREEGVDKPLVDDLAAVLRAQTSRRSVRAIAGRPVTVEGREPERIARLKGRLFLHGQRADLQVGTLRNPCRQAPTTVRRTAPAGTDRRHTTCRAAARRPAAGDRPSRASSTARRRTPPGRLPGTPPAPPARADEDGILRREAGALPHLERCARDLLQTRGQFAGCVPFRGCGAGLRHNHAPGLASRCNSEARHRFPSAGVFTSSSMQ